VPERVLILGGQGFVGAFLASHWLAGAADVRVTAAGRSPRSDAHFPHSLSWGRQVVRAPAPAALRKARADSRYDYSAVDILDESSLGALLADFRPQFIVHCASALRDETPQRLVQTNLLGTIALLQAVARAELAKTRIVLVSSGAVYGPAKPDSLPLREDSRCDPADFYGVSKLAAEQSAGILAGRLGLSVMIARLFNLIGAGEDERHLPPKLAARITAAEAGEGPPLLELGSLVATRDFIDVRDVASALEIIARKGEPLGAYNVGGGAEISCRRILDLMIEESPLAGKIEVRESAARPGDVQRNFADMSRLRSLGYQPRVPLRQSAGDLLEYYRTDVRAAAQKAGG
jgi:nucleoside-diphosphate-sugar epimerase